jgi:hypothetical protein
MARIWTFLAFVAFSAQQTQANIDDILKQFGASGSRDQPAAAFPLENNDDTFNQLFQTLRIDKKKPEAVKPYPMPISASPDEQDPMMVPAMPYDYPDPIYSDPDTDNKYLPPIKIEVLSADGNFGSGTVNNGCLNG